MGSDQQVLLTRCLFLHFEVQIGISIVPLEHATIMSIKVYWSVVSYAIRPCYSAPATTFLVECIVPSICVIHRETSERCRCRGCSRAVHHSCAGFIVLHGVFAYLYCQEAWARCWLYRYWHGIVIVPASGEGNDGHDEE